MSLKLYLGQLSLNCHFKMFTSESVVGEFEIVFRAAIVELSF